MSIRFINYDEFISMTNDFQKTLGGDDIHEVWDKMGMDDKCSRMDLSKLRKSNLSIMKGKRVKHIWICQNGAQNNIQNKHIFYKNQMFAFPNMDGAYMHKCGMMVSMNPVGNVLVVLK